MSDAAAQAEVIPYDNVDIDKRYRYWRVRIMYTTVIGYAIFYLLRTNIGVANAVLEGQWHVSHASLGLIVTLGSLTYGVSKLFNGFIGDRVNARYFMALGLLGTAVMNAFCGFSAGLITLGIFWMINSWFQGLGFPPCARCLAHWYAPSERARSFSIWNIGHQIGAGASFVLAGWAVEHYGWRYCFWAPVGIALLGVVFILERLRDTPGTLGLPPVETWKGEETPEQVRAEQHGEMTQAEFVRRYVFGSKYVWLASIANFFVYTLRYAALNWAPTFLPKMKGISLGNATWLTFVFEMAGLLGALSAGWLTDKVARGKAGRVSMAASVLLVFAVLGFWKTPGTSPKLFMGLFAAMGYLIYMPQMLVAVIVMDQSTKRAAATAVGLTGIFGYASSVLSGWGVGKLVDLWGWSAAFAMLVGCGVMMIVLFAMTWNVGTVPEKVLERQHAG